MIAEEETTLQALDKLMGQYRAEWDLYDPLEILAWEVIEGDYDGEEHLQVTFLLPDSDCLANVISETLITEVLQDYHFDLSSLDPRSFKRDDRDEIVNAMFKALEESDKARR